MCRLHLPSEVNLVREVEKLCRIYPSSNTEQDDSKAKGSDIQKDKNKKTFGNKINVKRLFEINTFLLQ